jgi:prolipoprotein diacylglyceryltransferase
LFIFSFLIGFGASIALLRLALVVQADKRAGELLRGLVVLAAALTGSRLAFVLLHRSYYADRTNEIAEFSQGGLWWPGALAGGLLAALMIALVKRRNMGKTLDAFSAMLLPLGVAFWLASWSAGVAYGVRLDPSIWWGIPTLDITGVTANRVPVQMAAAVTMLILLGGFEWLYKQRGKPGKRTAFVLLLLALHTLVFSFMRADPMQQWLGLRLDSWVCLFMVFLALLWFVLSFAVKSKADKNLFASH